MRAERAEAGAPAALFFARWGGNRHWQPAAGSALLPPSSRDIKGRARGCLHGPGCAHDVEGTVSLSRLVGIATIAMGLAAPVLAQVTPGGTLPPPDDTPSVRVGGTLFVDYTRILEPEVTDTDGDLVTYDAFNVTRAYINVTGQLNRLVAFRITPDITRETGTGSSLSGSLTVRLKYGYAQFNLDDWMWRGSHIRFGMIPTPYIEFEDSVYRYRFQGPTLTDREGYLPSSDLGAAFRTQFPGGYGEVVAGVYSGEGYTRAELNDQKALQVRGTLRPLPGPGPLRGLRVTAFYDYDHYVQDADRRRFVSLTSFEHRYVNAGWVYLDATDRTSLADARIGSSGQSFWVTPRWPHGALLPSPATGQVRASLEGLLRFDRLEPNHDIRSVQERWIGGVAYWPRMTNASLSSAILLDYDEVRYRDFAPARPTEKRITLHVLVSF